MGNVHFYNVSETVEVAESVNVDESRMLELTSLIEQVPENDIAERTVACIYDIEQELIHLLEQSGVSKGRTAELLSKYYVTTNALA